VSSTTEARGRADARGAFERDGYLVFDSGIPHEVLDGVLADVGDQYEPARIENGVVYTPGRIQDAWRVSRNVRAVALAPRVLSLLHELYDRVPLPFQTLNFAKGTEQAAHSDTLHFNAMPAGFMCGVWVALEDMDMDVGPLVYYAGSHRLPEVTFGRIGGLLPFLLSPSYERGVRLLRRFGLARSVVTPRENLTEALYVRYYEPYVAALIERHRLEPRYATIRKGQALIWAANLLHGGSPQRDRARTRHSQVTHYFFEGCRYYRPILERRTVMLRKQICWMTPERIQAPASQG
jgi:ectoine hydroxylase-related dioxygenase (phytanoyl-CoA dioxygenase family)